MQTVKAVKVITNNESKYIISIAVVTSTTTTTPTAKATSALKFAVPRYNS